jgi:hypothetical protein
MSHTLFSLGFPTTTAPWSYQHSLGISTREVVDWWKTAEKRVDTAIADVNAAGLGPTNAPPPKPVTPPPSEGLSGTTILLTVLLVGGALGGFYYYKKNMKPKGKKA